MVIIANKVEDLYNSTISKPFFKNFNKYEWSRILPILIDYSITVLKLRYNINKLSFNNLTEILNLEKRLLNNSTLTLKNTINPKKNLRANSICYNSKENNVKLNTLKLTNEINATNENIIQSYFPRYSNISSNNNNNNNILINLKNDRKSIDKLNDITSPFLINTEENSSNLNLNVNNKSSSNSQNKDINKLNNKNNTVIENSSKFKLDISIENNKNHSKKLFTNKVNINNDNIFTLRDNTPINESRNSKKTQNEVIINNIHNKQNGKICDNKINTATLCEKQYKQLDNTYLKKDTAKFVDSNTIYNYNNNKFRNSIKSCKKCYVDACTSTSNIDTLIYYNKYSDKFTPKQILEKLSEDVHLTYEFTNNKSNNNCCTYNYIDDSNQLYNNNTINRNYYEYKSNKRNYNDSDLLSKYSNAHNFNSSIDKNLKNIYLNSKFNDNYNNDTYQNLLTNITNSNFHNNNYNSDYYNYNYCYRDNINKSIYSNNTNSNYSYYNKKSKLHYYNNNDNNQSLLSNL